MDESRRSVHSLESVLTDEEMFNNSDRYQDADKHHMLNAMRYQVKKKVGFRTDQEPDLHVYRAGGGHLVQADNVLEEREIRPLDNGSHELLPTTTTTAAATSTSLRKVQSHGDNKQNGGSGLVDQNRFTTLIDVTRGELS